MEWLYITKVTSISRSEKGEMVYYSGGAPYTRLAVWQARATSEGTSVIVRQEHNHRAGEEALQVDKAISKIWEKEPVRRQHQSHIYDQAQHSKATRSKLIWWSWFGKLHSPIKVKNWVDLAGVDLMLSWFGGVDLVELIRWELISRHQIPQSCTEFALCM